MVFSPFCFLFEICFLTKSRVQWFLPSLFLTIFCPTFQSLLLHQLFFEVKITPKEQSTKNLADTAFGLVFVLSWFLPVIDMNPWLLYTTIYQEKVVNTLSSPKHSVGCFYLHISKIPYRYTVTTAILFPSSYQIWF